MFDGSIKVEINRVVHKLSNEQVKDLIRTVNSQEAYLEELTTQRDEARANPLQRRLDAANEMLVQLGYTGNAF